ncbi:bifunctional UDP-N-acetylglucosamine diphosphorylase/glucosamine-1-phosphate N-acetyltransferase GlmU [Rickettsiales bacterium LUAb2]
MSNILTSIILAAGNGTRMQSSIPKYAHKIGDFKLIEHVLHKTKSLQSAQTIIVASKQQASDLDGAFTSIDIAVQEVQNGSGSAVLAAKNKVTNKQDGIVLILYCDTPLISLAALNNMLDLINNNKSDLVILGFNEETPNNYGRLIEIDNQIVGIVEAKDLSLEQSNISLCNSGVMAVRASIVWDLLANVTNDNKANEYYLTDIVKIAKQKGFNCNFVREIEGNAKGVNTKLELAEMEEYFQNQQRDKFLKMGVTLVDKSSTYFSLDTQIGKDVIIHPQVVIKKGVTIEDQVTVESFCHLSEVILKKGSEVGPFARIRLNTIIGEDVKVGNFVEIKKSVLDSEVKTMHLSYIGDSTIGAKTNIGAGVITCNYDGINKNPTIIGENCFVGSNVSLVAPVELKNNSVIGAGSVITENVEENSLAIARSKQTIIKNWKLNKNV